jgi:hypothetical protein
MWLNADDFLAPGALEKLRICALQRLSAEIICGDCRFVEANGRKERDKKEGDFDLAMLVLYSCYIPSTATFFHRSIIDRGLFRDARYGSCVDAIGPVFSNNIASVIMKSELTDQAFQQLEGNDGRCQSLTGWFARRF